MHSHYSERGTAHPCTCSAPSVVRRLITLLLLPVTGPYREASNPHRVLALYIDDCRKNVIF